MIDIINLIKYENLSALKHCFTTRTGGVSEGGQFSLNLSFSREKSAENVCENYKRVADELVVDYYKMTRVPQTHTNHVLKITEELAGIGITKPFPQGYSDYGYDAMITDVPGVVLCTSHADCVPVLLYDNTHNAVGAVHSGWRGTAEKVSLKTVERMTLEYDTKPKDLKAVIGPSISIDKFECDCDVFEAFKTAFDDEFEKHSCKYIYKKGNKYHISVSGFVYETLLEAGLLPENIFIDKYCTYENDKLFFSHRRDKGNTGVMAAMISVAPKNSNT